jgi:N6-adenosine-specific RNA methylase IME4
LKYATIVADPPWKVAAGRTIGDYVRGKDGSQPFGVRNNAARKLSYPSMSVAEISALHVPAADNAHLYLWTINAYLEEAFQVVKAWGFKYSTTLVWAKAPMGGGLGGCYGLATEYVLFCRRGTLAANGRIPINWFDWPRPYDERGKPKHSAKPPSFFSMVKAMSPGPHLEMFARAPREDWDVWGNEVQSDVTLCSDCPPAGYSTEKTRCSPCPQRSQSDADVKSEGK